MLESNHNPESGGVEQALRTHQVVVGALLAGLLSFTGVVLALQTTATAIRSMAGQENPLLIAMAALSVATLFASFIMRRLHVGQLRKLADQQVDISPRLLITRFGTLTILRAALAEGPALFGTMIVLISGNVLGFAGTGLGALMLLIVFPTRGKFDAFVRDATGRAPGF
jgi:hypothetical protein